MKKEDLENMSLEELTKLSKDINDIKNKKEEEEKRDLRKWENRTLGKLQIYINEMEKYYKENPRNYATYETTPFLILALDNPDKNNGMGAVIPMMNLLSAWNNHPYLFGDQGIGIVITEKELLEAIQKVKKYSSPEFKSELKTLFNK